MRSNSKPALGRVLATIAGRSPDGKPAASLGGRQQPMVSLPAPPKEFASLTFAWDRDKLVEAFESLWKEATESQKQEFPFRREEIEEFLTKGIRAQLSLHVYDFSLPVGINLLELPGYLPMLGMGLFGQARQGPTAPVGPTPAIDPDDVPHASPQPPQAVDPGDDDPGSFRGVATDWLGAVAGFYLYGSFLSPMYAAVPVEDAAVVDRFLEKVDAALSKAIAEYASELGADPWVSYHLDFYTAPLAGCDTRLRCVAAWMGPIRLRLLYARIGRGLYFTNRPEVLSDLVRAENGHRKAEAGPAASALLRVRLDHAPLIRAAAALREAENNRRAALGNLGPLSAVARALLAERQKPPAMDEVLREAAALYGEQFTSPDGTR